MSSSIKLQKGTFLVAEPFLDEPDFHRTVVLLCEHNHEGSFGLVLNKKSDYSLPNAIPELEQFEHIPLYYGGPMEIDTTLHFVHQYPKLIDDCIMVDYGIFWGGNFEQVKHYLKNGQIDPQHIRFFLGYAGWDKGQLKDEIEDQKAWILLHATPEHIFMQNTQQLWRTVLQSTGKEEHRVISHFPNNPSLN